MDSNKQREQLLDSWLALTGEDHTSEDPIRLPMLSGSMLPHIPVQSVIHINKTKARYCRPGDVVVYRVGDRLVAHRLLLRLGWPSALHIFEKGDANDRGSWIRGHQVLGLAMAVELKDGEPAQPLRCDPNLAFAGLWADFLHRVLAFPRRLKRWIFSSRSGSDSGPQSGPEK